MAWRRTDTEQATLWINEGLVYWRMYATRRLNDLNISSKIYLAINDFE